MKNKNGFISISVIYSFFLVFIAIIAAIILLYSQRRLLMNAAKSDVRLSLKKYNNCITSGINNLKECLLFVYEGADKITEITDFSGEVETGLFKTQDDLGESYYFRGAVEDNYVQFGYYTEDTTLFDTRYGFKGWQESVLNIAAGTPMYWRVVRINGDGTIRLIYDGISLNANGIKHLTSVAAIAFNSNLNDAKYVGYTYDNNGVETDSSVKNKIEEWYSEHLNDHYAPYISDGIFCNDRTVYSIDSDEITYAAYNRVENKTPSLKCENNYDKYTVNSNLGNGLLDYPVGLINVDEAVMAGGTYGLGNSTYYLYNGGFYWTMSPFVYSNNFKNMGRIEEYGNIDGFRIDGIITSGSNIYVNGVRPVINLKADVVIESGNGTVKSPYKIKVN